MIKHTLPSQTVCQDINSHIPWIEGRCPICGSRDITTSGYCHEHQCQKLIYNVPSDYHKYNLDDFIGMLSDKEAEKLKERIRKGRGLLYDDMVCMLKSINMCVIPADVDIPDNIVWKIAKEYGITP